MASRRRQHFLYAVDQHANALADGALAAAAQQILHQRFEVRKQRRTVSVGMLDNLGYRGSCRGSLMA